MKFFQPGALKIIDEANMDGMTITTIQHYVNVIKTSANMSAAKYASLCDKAFEGLKDFCLAMKAGEPLLIEIFLDTTDFKDFNEDDFISHVNFIVASFFDKFCAGKQGWPREHRLGLPEEINLHLNTSYTIAMSLINYKNLTPNDSPFNLMVTVDGAASYQYLLVN